MPLPTPSPQPPTGIRCDALIHGAGHAGLTAAAALAEAGLQVLVIEDGGRLLPETCQNLGVDARGCTGSTAYGLHAAIADNSTLNPIRAEALASQWLLSHPNIRLLLGAQPVAAVRDGARIAGVVLATKAGLRTATASVFLDASDGLAVARLDGCTPATPAHRGFRRVLALCNDWPAVRTPLTAWCEENGWRLEPGYLPNLAILASGPHHDDPGAARWIAVLRSLRQALPAAPALLVAQLADVPAAAQAAGGAHRAPNLLLRHFADDGGPPPLHARVEAGRQLARNVLDLLPFPPAPDPRDLESPDVAEGADIARADVIVAGTGTAGALAALAAARQGCATIALDTAPAPGGVGTQAGITAYFNGVTGGLQDEVDALAADLATILTGRTGGRGSWHHEAKRLAIETLFDAAGVRFLGRSTACGVTVSPDGWLGSVLVGRPGGLLRVRGTVFIDSTGDGDLCAAAGAPFESGRAGDGRCLAYSLASLGIEGTPDAPELRGHNFDAGWVDATDPDDLTRARLAAAAQYLGVVEAGGKAIVHLHATLGIRQSRHILTERRLQLDDLVRETAFPDAVGLASCHADTHSVDFEFESDELAFFIWACRLFRLPLRTQLPYRMLLPQGLRNVLIACRAAGIEPDASYAIRMQRDMQRLGEIAGTAAALALQDGGRVATVSTAELRGRLQARTTPEMPAALPAEPFAALANGSRGPAMWLLYKADASVVDPLRATLRSESAELSFAAACVLAMRRDPAAEPRLLAAIEEGEELVVADKTNLGAFGQEIDAPAWLVAVVLLRRCGTAACLPALLRLARVPHQLLNIRTAIALTAERLAQIGTIPRAALGELAAALVDDGVPDAHLEPSRSLHRRIMGQPALRLYNDIGADTRSDHAWQLHLVVARLLRLLGVPPQPEATAYLRDPRGHVRLAFQGVLNPEHAVTPAAG